MDASAAFCRESPGGTGPTFTGKVLFSCRRTKQQQGGEEKLGRDEISPVSAMCSCLDAAEHLQPQLSTCCLCFVMTAAAQPRLPCPAALSAFRAQGQDLGLWPGEMQQSSGDAVLGMLPAHKRL